MKPTYEELEQQLAAVVAENAVLKDDYRDTPALKRMGWPKTPATDATIANIKAQGVEMLLASLPPHYTARADIESFAAQLRQGAPL